MSEDTGGTECKMYVCLFAGQSPLLESISAFCTIISFYNFGEIAYGIFSFDMLSYQCCLEAMQIRSYKLRKSKSFTANRFSQLFCLAGNANGTSC